MKKAAKIITKHADTDRIYTKVVWHGSFFFFFFFKGERPDFKLCRRETK